MVVAVEDRLPGRQRTKSLSGRRVYGCEWFVGFVGSVPPLSPKLVTEVLTWANDFNDNYAIEAGWPSQAAARSHERQSHRLLQLVERDLSAEDDVVLGYWETTGRNG